MKAHQWIYVVLAVLVGVSGVASMAPQTRASDHEGTGLYAWPHLGYGSNEYESTLSGYVGLPFEGEAYADCRGGEWS
ncbi:MAG: hypothetical protein QGI52_05365, partial [Alphaproteobacteria bacterium]|nr:hypothetical protein [Alphaproteobacteria bacterium]